MSRRHGLPISPPVGSPLTRHSGRLARQVHHLQENATAGQVHVGRDRAVTAEWVGRHDGTQGQRTDPWARAPRARRAAPDREPDRSPCGAAGARLQPHGTIQLRCLENDQHALQRFERQDNLDLVLPQSPVGQGGDFAAHGVPALRLAAGRDAEAEPPRLALVVLVADQEDVALGPSAGARRAASCR